MHTRTSLFRNPLFRLRFVTDEEKGGGEKKGDELGFPADTPFEEMTIEQQLAYSQNEASKWKSLSRKHEKNRKPETHDADMAELAEFRKQRDDALPADAKAAAAATQAAADAAAAKATETLLIPAVRAEFRARAPHLSDDDLEEFLEDINVTADRFLTDGQINTDRIDRLAKRIAAPEPEDDGDDKAPKFNLGDVLKNDSRKNNKGSGDPRKEAYERTRARFAKKSTESK